MFLVHANLIELIFLAILGLCLLGLGFLGLYARVVELFKKAITRR